LGRKPHDRRKLMSWDDGWDAGSWRASGKPFEKPWKLVTLPPKHSEPKGSLSSCPTVYEKGMHMGAHRSRSSRPAASCLRVRARACMQARWWLVVGLKNRVAERQPPYATAWSSLSLHPRRTPAPLPLVEFSHHPALLVEFSLAIFSFLAVCSSSPSSSPSQPGPLGGHSPQQGCSPCIGEA
jgi:hypothetical protein